MKIIDLLKKDAIALNVSLTDKEEAIDKLISLHEKAGNLADKAAYKEAILAREAQGSTAIGEGIAVPHAKSDSVKTPGLSAITVPNGVDYGAPDSKPSDILFMIAAPVDGDLHLEILSRLMVMLMEPEFCAALRGAKTTDEFLEIIDKKEAEKYPEEAVKPEVKPKGYRILAVTACPTGIAHTYMHLRDEKADGLARARRGTLHRRAACCRADGDDDRAVGVDDHPSRSHERNDHRRAPDVPVF